MSITGYIFIAVFATVMWLAVFRSPLFGLYAYVAVFYLHPPSRWWGLSLPDVRWSLVAAGVTLLAIWIRQPPQIARSAWFKPTPAILMILFVIWFWISSLWALSDIDHSEAAVIVTKYVLVYYFFYRLLDTPDKVMTFLGANLLGCLYLGYLGYTQHVAGRLDGVGGPGINDSNTLGMHLAVGAIAGTMVALKHQGWRLYLAVISLAFSVNAMILTGSRGAFLGLVAGGLAVFALRPRAYRKKFYAFSVLGLLMIGALATQQYWDRVQTVEQATGEKEVTDNSIASRLAMMRAQLEMAKRYPMGTGHRGSAALSPQYLEYRFLSGGIARSSHNSFLTALVEQGIPGALLFIAMVVWVGRTMLRLRQLAGSQDDGVQTQLAVASIGGALTVALAAGLFADFSKYEVQVWLFALLASLQQYQLANLEPASRRP